jgi:hypothetical protein
MNQPSDRSADALPRSMNLYDDYRPHIRDGAYRLVVQQSVSFTDLAGQAVAHHYHQDQRFVVMGPRYALPNGDVHARFPPAHGSGDYKGTMPHVVLRKRALPWERPMWATGPGEPAVPWMALLVLTQAELAQAACDLDRVGPAGAADRTASADPLTSMVTPRDLLSRATTAAPSGYAILQPELSAQADADDHATQVKVLDLPLELFRSVAPRHQDLPYLAHLRRVDPGDKVPLHMHGTGDFPVVVANRLTQPGSNVAFLVSLEGWGSLLLGERQDAAPNVHAAVRLIVLETWTFNDDEAGVDTFADRMQGLDIAVFGAGRAPAPDAAQDPAVTAALERGAVPMACQGWRSPPDYGWYHGPLAATGTVLRGSDPPFFDRADAALVFDEASGLLDISYAAAWQLGQLTAIASPAIVQELRRFMDQHHDAFAAAAEVQRFLALHSSAVQRQAMAEAVAAKTSADAPPADGATASPAADADQALPAPAAAGGDTDIVAARHVQAFLARLALLYPVPFDYLVAHDRLLPAEAIRFFVVDNTWLEALVDGALSLAHQCSLDAARMADGARQHLHDAISRFVAQYHRHQQGLRELDPDQPADFPYMVGTKSGFLLRSSVLAGWPGLEITCYDTARRPMPVLRMDTLGSDLMLCIVAGPIGHVVIREPGEGLRFGLDALGLVMLRHWRGPQPLGAPLGDDEHIDGRRFRPQSPAGVLDIQALATALSGATGDAASASHFRSAAFALQMTRSPQKLQIDVGPNADSRMIKDGIHEP